MSEESEKGFNHLDGVAVKSKSSRRLLRRPVCSMNANASVDITKLAPDLLRHQRDAYESFLQINTPHELRKPKGLHGMLLRAFPVKGKNTTGVYILEYVSL